MPATKKKEEVKKQEAVKPTVAEFKKHIKETDLKLHELKGTNSVKYEKIICYVRDTKYGLSVWFAIGKNKGKTKQVKNTDELTAFVDMLKDYVCKERENAKKEK